MNEHLRRFYIPNISEVASTEVDPAEAKHMLRVLRMTRGDDLIAFDGTGVECLCRITEASGRHLHVEVIERRQVSREPNIAVTLAIAAAKTKAMDLVVQKCTELGLARLIPFHSGRSVAKINDNAKLDKWRRATIEAAKQCGRNVLPDISHTHDIDELASAAGQHDLAVVAAVGEKTRTLASVLRSHPALSSIMYVIGPEGGFSDEEIHTLSDAGVVPVSLGRSILRVETAAVSALAMIVYHYSS